MKNEDTLTTVNNSISFTTRKRKEPVSLRMNLALQIMTFHLNISDLEEEKRTLNTKTYSSKIIEGPIV